MAVIEIGESREGTTQRQRYSHYFAVAFGLIGIVIGLNLRDSTLSATTQFADTRAGIRAFYPQNWLLDTSGEGYVFQVQDMTQPGFKTLIQVSMRPVGAETTTRTVLEQLSLGRFQTLAQYSVLSVEDFTLEEQPPGARMEYAFATGDIDPFLESVPTVVRAIDVLTIKRGQAIIITFRADTRAYEETLPLFEQFLADMEF